MGESYSPNGRGVVREENGEGVKHTNHIDRDSLHSITHFLQDSRKSDTLPLRWMPLTLGPILPTSTGCSFQSEIEFLKDLH